MNIYTFITQEELENITKCIKKKRQFKTVERKAKGYEFRIRSGEAGAPFNEEVTRGDYMIALGFSASTRGNGIPLAGDKLKGLEDVNNLKHLVDSYLSDCQIEGYKKIGEESQLTLFKEI